MSTSRPQPRPAATVEAKPPPAGTNPTVYRDACGSFQGLRLHQASGEPPCSECLRGEVLRLLELECIPQPANRRYSGQSSMTEAPRGAANRAVLQHELDAIAEERNGS